MNAAASGGGVAFYTTFGPIPLSAIRQWSELRGFDRESTMLLADVIRFLDGKRAEREEKQRAAQGKR